MADESNPVQYAQDVFNAAVQEGEARQKRYNDYADWTKYLAYVLKGIALFGGLVVATIPITSTILGFIISAAVLIDQLFSNQVTAQPVFKPGFAA